MSAVSFPFKYEEYILNNKNIIKFIHLTSNKYGLCEFNKDKIYLLKFDNTNFILFFTEENRFEFFYNYTEEYSQFITENNEFKIRKSIPLFKYSFLIYKNPINKDQIYQFFKLHFHIDFIFCSIKFIESDLSNVKGRIAELNQYLYLNCQHKYQLNLDYAYRMNNLVAFELDESFGDDINSLFLCLNLNDTCVSSIDFLITIQSELKCIMITSKTMEGHEGNSYNKLLRAVTMLLAPYFDVSHLYSEAINPISAYLLIKMFKNNEYDRTFTKYLNKRNLTEDDLTFDILDAYIDKKDEINIFSPVDENNLLIARNIFVNISGSLPCELDFPMFAS